MIRDVTTPAPDVTETRAGVTGSVPRWSGLLTTARRLSGEQISYADEVESCYGVRPHPIEWDRGCRGAQAAGGRSSRKRVRSQSGSPPGARPTQSTPDRLVGAIGALADDLRERTERPVRDPRRRGLRVRAGDEQAVVRVQHLPRAISGRGSTSTPTCRCFPCSCRIWSRTRHIPGHHTEHTRKEVGLVRGRHWLEETIFLVGTPQCLIAEGLADLGLRVVHGPPPRADRRGASSPPRDPI